MPPMPPTYLPCFRMLDFILSNWNVSEIPLCAFSLYLPIRNGILRKGVMRLEVIEI